MKKEIFLGPVFCASIYSALNDPSILKETDPAKRITLALVNKLGDKASKYVISYITAGKGKEEVSSHARQINQLLEEKFDFEVDHSCNRDYFYLESGQPRGYYVEGLLPADEKTLINVFQKQYLIISPSEMKALGFDESNPRSALNSLNKIVPLVGRIVLIGKNNSVCVVAESEKLQQLKEGMPQPIPMSPAKALTILYHAETTKEEKYSTDSDNLESLQQGVADLNQLSSAFEKLSIKCSVDLVHSKNLQVVALPEERSKIEKLWETSLVEFNHNMCQYLNVEIDRTSDSITGESVAQFLGNKNFQFLPGPAIITRDESNLQKLWSLRGCWLEIENDYIRLLNSQAKDSQTPFLRVKIKLVEQKIIPASLPVESRESSGNIFKISTPDKYKADILKHCVDFVSEHSLEVTPVVAETLYQQTGIKEIKSALSSLQQKGRLPGNVFTTVKSNKSYIIFANKDNIDVIKNWVRRPILISPVYKTAVKLQALSVNAPSNVNFKSACDFLKIVTDHPFSFLSTDGAATEIKVDPDNLESLNTVVANYVLIGINVYNFILPSLTMGSCDHLCLATNSTAEEHIISRKFLEDIYSKTVPPLFVSTRNPRLVMTNPCLVGHNQPCDLSEVDEEKDCWYSYEELGKQIALWKKVHNFAPLECKPLPRLQYSQTLEQDQKVIQPAASHSAAKNTYALMSAKSNSSKAGSGVNTESKKNSSSNSSSSSSSSSSSGSTNIGNRF